MSMFKLTANDAMTLHKVVTNLTRAKEAKVVDGKEVLFACKYLSKFNYFLEKSVSSLTPVVKAYEQKNMLIMAPVYKEARKMHESFADKDENGKPIALPNGTFKVTVAADKFQEASEELEKKFEKEIKLSLALAEEQVDIEMLPIREEYLPVLSYEVWQLIKQFIA